MRMRPLALGSFVALGVACSPEGPLRRDTGVDIDAVSEAGVGPDGAQTDAERAEISVNDAGFCAAGERRCGAACCTGSEVCGTNRRCCPRAALCGEVCCDAGQVCDGAICRRDCGANARCGDGSGGEVCCASGEVCASGRCFRASTTCADFESCPAGQYCESAVHQCLPNPAGEACQTRPGGGAVRPTLVWAWTGEGRPEPSHNQVMMTPIVVNLTDDNGDRRVDERDVPDVVFSTFERDYTQDGIVRAVSGRDGAPIFDAVAPALRVVGGAQLAAGDLDGDGRVEIVACGTASNGIGPVLVFHADGTLYWQSRDPRVQCPQAAPGIGDFDGDGHPEVYVRYTILDGRTGAVRAHRACENTGNWATNAHSPCDYTTAADLDGDGLLELVGGNMAMRLDGSTLWNRASTLRDGYPTVGDLNADGQPEVIVVQSAFSPSPYQGDHFLLALDGRSGRTLWGPIDVNQGHASPDDVPTMAVGGGGPATLANFDRDPEPEIALAGAYGYAVFESTGALRWFSPTRDFSSRKTGSSVFDFDGDGVAEAVYNDEYWLRVYDGSTGTVRYCECNTSATLWEYPVVADVDNDGHAEIVVAENDYGHATCPADTALDECTRARVAAGDTRGGHGIRVFAGPMRDWVGTRRVWNQHGYHVTNVSEAGAIPAREVPNWRVAGLNNFRQNTLPGAANAPDLRPVDLSADLLECPAAMVLNVRVRNDGWSSAPAGVAVAVTVRGPGITGERALETVRTTRALLPGESEGLRVRFALDGLDASAEYTFRVTVNPAGAAPAVRECRGENNQAEHRATCGVIIGMRAMPLRARSHVQRS